jgi:hypothetical protein
MTRPLPEINVPFPAPVERLTERWDEQSAGQGKETFFPRRLIASATRQTARSNSVLTLESH